MDLKINKVTKLFGKQKALDQVMKLSMIRPDPSTIRLMD